MEKTLWDILLIFLFDSWLFIFWCSTKSSFLKYQKAKTIIKASNLISFNIGLTKVFIWILWTFGQPSSYRSYFQCWNFRIIFISFYMTPYIELFNKYYQFFHYNVSHIGLYIQNTFQKPSSILHNTFMNYKIISLIVSFISSNICSRVVISI